MLVTMSDFDIPRIVARLSPQFDRQLALKDKTQDLNTDLGEGRLGLSQSGVHGREGHLSCKDSN